ncbi:MAG: hypothetical protein IJD40_12685 [Lachnospiraceae bacterium]|nr:hypothetical protein [Lachnospiraceae bacterium]
MYERMFFIGMFFCVLNFAISIILFLKNGVLNIIRDMMGWRQTVIVPQEYIKEQVTDILMKQDICVEQLFQIEEDIVITHTENRM